MISEAVLNCNYMAAIDMLDKTNFEHTDLGVALILASSAGQLQLVRKLADCGADINYRPVTGDWIDYTPLYAAARHGHDDVISLLLEKGANVDLAPFSSGATPLYAAIDYEADTASQLGTTPCMTSSLLLLNKGANPDICDSRGNTARRLAHEYGFVQAIKCFDQHHRHLK